MHQEEDRIPYEGCLQIITPESNKAPDSNKASSSLYPALGIRMGRGPC